MDKSLFPKDLAFEQVIGSYLDHHLYFNPLFTEHRRCTDQDAQDRGVDIILTSNEFNLSSAKVDEKCAAHHCNEDMRTFAFEILSLIKGQERIGWFVNRNKETEAYLLVWPFVNDALGTGRIESITEKDITGVRYLIVKRDKLSAYLEKRGFTYERMIKDAKLLMANQSCRIRTGYSQFHYSKSPKYAESPVNLVINRDTLWRLADLKGDVVGNILTPLNEW